MPYPYLNPTSGLGSYGRITGATLVSTPRATYGSSKRIYNYLAQRNGSQYAINYFNNIAFGKYKICGKGMCLK